MAGQMIDVDKYKYNRVKVRGPDGKARYTAGNRDAIAKSMFGMTKDDLRQVIEDNHLDLSKHFDKNMGHIHMIVGQALRNMVVQKKPVVIRGVRIKTLDQKVSWPKGFVEEPKGTHEKPIRRGRIAS